MIFYKKEGACIFITECYIRRDIQQYTGEEISVSLILNYLQNDKNDNLFVSVDAIGYFLIGSFINSQSDKNLIKNIKKGFEGLQKKEKITILGQDKNNYIIDSQSCRIDIQKYKFVIIHLWEIQKIFSSLGAYGFNVLRFFVNIIGTINSDSKSWHMTQDDMVLNWGFNKKTINEYLRNLEELELLYTFRSKARKVDETFHRVGNVYGRYCDKEAVDEEGMEYLSKVPSYPVKPFHFNRTSVKLKYNKFLQGSKKYDSREEVEKLYKECIGYNDSFKDFPNGNIGYLDLGVFDKYGFDISAYKSEKNNSLVQDFTMEEIVDILANDDFASEPAESTKENVQDVVMYSDGEIQIYADELFKEEGYYGTEAEKPSFIKKLAKEFPGLDDYGKYYDNARLSDENWFRVRCHE